MTERDETDEITFIAVGLIGESASFYVADGQWDEIDASYHNWIERRIDRVISLTGHDGAEILLAASRISSVYRSTPVVRERARSITSSLNGEKGFDE